jgi:hypothetical protein
MDSRPVLQFTSPINNAPRIPPDIDEIVEKVARLELRKKNAVVTLAVTEYVASHHPHLLKEQKAVRG